ncbi:MAG: efflux RND transporter periplasmic adaptor subunit [Planctomycetota bacterium]
MANSIKNLFLLGLLLCVDPLSASESDALSLVTAQRAGPSQITATGRVVPLLVARMGARVTGQMLSLGKTTDGQWVDIGISVKAGDELFSVDTTTFKLAVAVSQAALNEAQAALIDLKAGVRKEQRDALIAATEEIDAHLDELRRDEKRFQELIKIEGAASQKQLEQVQFQIRAQQARRGAAQSRVEEANAGPTLTAVAIAAARVAQAQAALDIALQDLKDTSVRAPYDGIITRRFKSPGDFLLHMPFTEVVELVSLQFLAAELRLPEACFTQIIPGQTQVTLRSSLLNEPLTLPITRAIPAIDPQQGSFGIWVALPLERCGRLIPGAFLQGDVRINGVADEVIVPRRAIRNSGAHYFVFVAEDGKMRQCSVEVGEYMTETAILKTGVKAGQKIILGPQEALKDGADLPPELLIK